MGYLFHTLKVWNDQELRRGAENMALDEMLLKNHSGDPLLRVYNWVEPTVSFGYFLQLAEVQKSFSNSELVYVRRWTGGGVVDHRIDLTYTLVIPRPHPIATMRGAYSYRSIHSMLADVFVGLGGDALIASHDLGGDAVLCFQNPVTYDVIDSQGRKIAGAGQRRTKYGLLHQGSLIADVSRELFFGKFARAIGCHLETFYPDDLLLSGACQLAKERYASDTWLNKR